MIAGQTFRTSRSEYQTVFFGDVVSIATAGAQSSLNVQDSFVGSGPAGVGRNVVEFNASFAPGGVTFDGANAAIQPSLLRFGNGLIADLLESGGVTLRDGSIAFRLTSVSVSPAGTLVESVIDIAPSLRQDQVAGLMDKINAIVAKLEAGHTRPACNQLGAFENQIQAFIRNRSLSPATGETVIQRAEDVGARLGC
jgi:hypothetical protein